jgi:predicted esterase
MIARLVCRAVCALSLLPLLVVLASAQDAGQVLRLSVGYISLKNSTKLDAEKTAEVDKLAKMAQAANASQNYGEALKDYYHAMTVIRGKEWSASAELGFSMAVELKSAMLEQNDKDQVKLRSIYKVEQQGDGPVTGAISLVKGVDVVAQLAVIGKVDSDLSVHPMEWTVTIPELPDGVYKLRVALKPGSGDQVNKDVDIHVERGLGRRIQSAHTVIGTLQSSVKSPPMLDALATAEYHVELYKLASASEISLAHIDFDKEVDEAAHELAELNLGHNPYKDRHGDFRRAYLSAVDNTLQPYRIYVPTTYDGTKPFPLVIALHGMGGDENSYFDQYANGAFKVEAEKRGYIVACPKGRKTASMYLGDAEKDVLDVLAAVERDYSIGRDRVYLTGHSMGGYGTWSMAMAHPDLFAAIAPISGGGNPARMSQIAHIPALVVHGDADNTVPVQRSREMVEAGKKAGEEVKYIEVAGGSHISVPVPTFKDVFDWFDSHPKKSPASAETSARQ